MEKTVANNVHNYVEGDVENISISEIIQNASLHTDSHSEELILDAFKTSPSGIMEKLPSSDIGMFIADFNTYEVLMVNETLSNLLGLDPEEMIGGKCWSIMSKNNTEPCKSCPYEHIIDEEGIPTGPYVWETYHTDTKIWLKCKNELIKWVDGRLANMVSLMDITYLKKSEHDLSYLAFYDHKFDLPNLLKLENDLNRFLEKDYEQTFLICFDILALRNINSMYGRETGDKLLSCIKAWLLYMKDKNIEVYKTTEDEFALLLSRSSLGQAKDIANAIKEKFSGGWNINSNNLNETIFCNVAISIIPGTKLKDEGSEFMSLIERTLNGSNKTAGIVIYDDELDNQLKEYLKISVSLERCVRNGMIGFDVHYQPIVNSITGTWIGVEALCRWECPELGTISPDIFIVEAERLKIIDILGEWVLERAVRQCKEWKLDQKSNFFIDVNLSPQQLLDNTIDQKVVEILNKYDFPPEKLTLELTESIKFDFETNPVHSLIRLKDLHINIALDDFGTGYSSFENLKNMPVTTLKTERSFVKGITSDPYLQTLFKSMSELAHSAGMKIIAEGIETEEQIKVLLKYGIDYFQGFYFSKPLSAEKFQKNLDKFSVSKGMFKLISQQKIDIMELLDAESNYIFTNETYKLLNKSMQMLLYYPNITEAIDKVLELVGTEFDVSINLYFCNYDDIPIRLNDWGDFSNIPAIEKEKMYKNFLKIWPEWRNMLNVDGAIIASNINYLPKSIENHMELLKVKSMLVIPFWNENQINGFISLYDTKKERYWKSEEALVLHNLCMIISNLLNQKKYQKYLEEYASIDMQTGVLHKSAFVKELDKVLQEFEGSDIPISIAFIDIDNLKIINDTMGHDAGDIFISQVVSCINRVLNNNDLFGRYGGDEFIVTFVGDTIEIARKKLIQAQQSLQAISSTYNFNFGLASEDEAHSNPNEDPINTLISLADQRMLSSKNAIELY